MKNGTQILGLMLMMLSLTSTVSAQSPTIRLQVVNVPVDGGLLAALLPDFERMTGYRVNVQKTGDEAYDLTRQGAGDLVLSHYGHRGVDDFMADGLGLWPRTVFANQAVLVGPMSDPAGIRGIQDAVEAFGRIARTKSRFIVNNAATEKYLAQLLWEAAGRPNTADWYMDTGIRDQPAIQAAERSEAYVLWGIIPFLKFKEASNSRLETFVLDDSLLQRMMFTVVPNPEKIPGVNVAGAISLQRYLTLPSTQARIRAFRYPGVSQQLFWPAGRDNIGSFLSDNSPLPTIADPIANAITFSTETSRAGSTVTATFAGANLSSEMYFDVRFRRPGGTSDDVAENWQRGLSGSHNIPASSPSGTWRITAVRVHRDITDHSGTLIPVIRHLVIAP